MPRSRRSERSCDYSARLEDWSVTDCKRILRRRKGAVLWITCMAGFGASLITSAQPRVYESRALLEIQSLNGNFLNFRDIYPAAASNVESASYVQTQAELLQQDSLIEEVARNLDLKKRPEFRPPSDLLGKLRQDIRIAPLRNSRIILIVCDATQMANLRAIPTADILEESLPAIDGAGAMASGSSVLRPAPHNQALLDKKVRAASLHSSYGREKRRPAISV